MTTADLIKELQKFPPDMRVAVWDPFNDCATLDIATEVLPEVEIYPALLITNG